MMKNLIVMIGALISFSGFSQDGDPKVKEKALAISNNLTYDANTELAEDNFDEAEANYRKAISKSDENTAARYNMGNAYYKEDSMGEAFLRYKQASEVAQTKPEKHKTYHNMGNVFMKNKEYEKAVEAYKEALRNNPSDEETRYNLALAKELLKKQQEEQKNDQNKDDQNKDKNQDQENKDNQDKKEDEGEQDKKDDEGEKKDGEDKDENKDGKGNEEEKEKEEKDKKGEQPEEKKDKQKPRPNQLSPQQMKNILEAMNNEEKKVQEKVNAKKVKGSPVKGEKDW